jgi:intracellular sulfur oxidation DsrE/DsrF family protein
MKLRYLLPVLLVSLGTSSQADEPSLGPVIEGYGPTFPIDERDVLLEEGAVYRAVFDVAAYSDDLGSLSARLNSVARFLNMHGRNETPVESMQLAVVLHGAAVKNVLSHDAYRARYKMDNPNLELVGHLHDAGVRFYVCGQSMTFGGVDKSEIVDQVQVALSAMTMLTVLQNDGYALLP